MDDRKIDPALLGMIRTHVRHESRLIKRAGGLAAFVPSYRTYTREDLALLMATARANGGLLPIQVRAALLSAPKVNPEKKELSTPGFTLVDDTKSMRNRRKRARKAQKP